MKTTKQKKNGWTSTFKLPKRNSKNFRAVHVRRIPRTYNSHANVLARLAMSDGIDELDTIPMKRLHHWAIEKQGVISIIVDPKPTWMDEITLYLKKGLCPPKTP